MHARLQAADRLLGDQQRTLSIGETAIRIEGLDDDLCLRLEPRWGAFLEPRAPCEPRAVLQVVDGGAGHWLGAPRSGEVYRLDCVEHAGRRLIASYHFAVAPDGQPRSWRLALTRGSDEPVERILENAVRYLTAVVTAEDGGFAMHAAGVLHEGRAFLFAGPSRAGKSTVVRLLSPAVSLGDDFGLVLPGPEGWVAPALPFDNAERSPGGPCGQLFPVAGIWRLFQSEVTRLERPAPGLIEASLLGCVAFAWAMPEASTSLLQQVGRFVAEGRFEHLHFEQQAELWSLLIHP